ncbi:MAG: pteridine reductase [Moraxellaceae bacterium]|nr:pteridine reductase [Moraxellaceae bacterium]
MNNPIILVTGSAKRIGAEIIRQAHAHGYDVIIHYHHSHSQAFDLAKQLNKIRSNSAKIIQADLALIYDSKKLEEFVQQVISAFGRLDALINNASNFYPTDLTNSTHQQIIHDWNDLFLTNAQAPFLLAYAFLPYLQKNSLSKNTSSIINILDIHADGKPFKNYSIYNMAKASGQMMVQSLALEFAPKVRVNGVAPGTNIFPEMDSEHALSPTLQQQIEKSIPLVRIGNPSDIAQAVIYLLQANYVTGQIIAIDGGRSLTLAGG